MPSNEARAAGVRHRIETVRLELCRPDTLPVVADPGWLADMVQAELLPVVNEVLTEFAAIGAVRVDRLEVDLGEIPRRGSLVPVRERLRTSLRSALAELNIDTVRVRRAGLDSPLAETDGFYPVEHFLRRGLLPAAAPKQQISELAGRLVDTARREPNRVAQLIRHPLDGQRVLARLVAQFQDSVLTDLATALGLARPVEISRLVNTLMRCGADSPRSGPLREKLWSSLLMALVSASSLPNEQLIDDLLSEAADCLGWSRPTIANAVSAVLPATDWVTSRRSQTPSLDSIDKQRLAGEASITGAGEYAPSRSLIVAANDSAPPGSCRDEVSAVTASGVEALRFALEHGDPGRIDGLLNRLRSGELSLSRLCARLSERGHRQLLLKLLTVSAPEAEDLEIFNRAIEQRAERASNRTVYYRAVVEHLLAGSRVDLDGLLGAERVGSAQAAVAQSELIEQLARELGAGVKAAQPGATAELMVRLVRERADEVVRLLRRYPQSGLAVCERLPLAALRRLIADGLGVDHGRDIATFMRAVEDHAGRADDRRRYYTQVLRCSLYGEWIDLDALLTTSGSDGVDPADEGARSGERRGTAAESDRGDSHDLQQVRGYLRGEPGQGREHLLQVFQDLLARTPERLLCLLEDEIEGVLARQRLSCLLPPALWSDVRRLMDSRERALRPDSRLVEVSRAQTACLEPSEQMLAAGVRVSNAGLVLVVPYLSRLFSMLGMVEENHFIDPAAQERAAYLLQWMVDGLGHSPEFELVLNKLLCGLDLDWPTGPAIAPSEAEQEAAEGLLRAIIQHWDALGRTSLGGLRESFLQRTGTLRYVNDCWRLSVEPRAFDMLLDRLPWSYAAIKLAWMEEVIHVDWR